MPTITTTRRLDANPGRYLEYGRACLPWNEFAQGWALPGGDIVSGKNARLALEIVERMHRLMHMKPGLYSAKAAQLSTENATNEEKKQ